MDCQKTRPFYNSTILLRRLYEITRIHHRRSTECHYLLVQLFLLMEWHLVKFFLWTLLFILIRENKCYMEEERIGLLEFKGFLKSNIKNTNFLLSWVNKAKSECCKWGGVRCNAIKGHVIELSLNNLWQFENFASDYVYAWLNVSLLHPFKELRILDLYSNSFRGWLGNEGM